MTVRVLKAKVAPKEIGVAYTTSPVGPLTVIASERGLLAVECGRLSGGDIRELVAARGCSTATVGGSSRAFRKAEKATDQIGQYFDGDRRVFSAELDLFGVTVFRDQVLTELLTVPFASLTTYGELAAKVGKPRGAQAVGGAVGANPWVIMVPCHRVIAGDGTLGGFSSGLARKRRLLAHEGIAPLAGGWPGRAG
jgi:methylated-DNA-[protein]-cysteine S-methyltransferase